MTDFTNALCIHPVIIIYTWSKGKTLPLHAIRAYRGNGDSAAFILNLSTTWKWVVNLRLWPLSRRGKLPTVPTELGGWVGPSARATTKLDQERTNFSTWQQTTVWNKTASNTKFIRLIVDHVQRSFRVCTSKRPSINFLNYVDYSRFHQCKRTV